MDGGRDGLVVVIIIIIFVFVLELSNLIGVDLSDRRGIRWCGTTVMIEHVMSMRLFLSGRRRRVDALMMHGRARRRGHELFGHIAERIRARLAHRSSTAAVRFGLVCGRVFGRMIVICIICIVVVVVSSRVESGSDSARAYRTSAAATSSHRCWRCCGRRTRCTIVSVARLLKSLLKIVRFCFYQFIFKFLKFNLFLCALFTKISSLFFIFRFM